MRIPKQLLYLAAAVSVCVIGASAYRLATRAAANPDPFQGISAAENAAVLPASDPAVAQMQMLQSGPFGENLNGVRRLPSVIAGHAAYVMPTNTGAFCLVVAQMPEACEKPFAPSTSPVLFVEGSSPAGSASAGVTAFGIAEDGVVSITMTVNGSQVKVPVQANTFEYTGGPSVTPESITNVTANFADGHSVGLN